MYVKPGIIPVADLVWGGGAAIPIGSAADFVLFFFFFCTLVTMSAQKREIFLRFRRKLEKLQLLAANKEKCYFLLFSDNVSAEYRKFCVSYHNFNESGDPPCKQSYALVF